MKTFKIEIQEFLSKTIEVNALNLDDAILKVKKMYNNEEVVLSEADCVSTEISEYLEK